MKTSDSTHQRHIRRTGVPDPNPNHTSGKVANAATVYFELGGQEDIAQAVHIRWLDATTSGTFTLWSTNLTFAELPLATSTSLAEWFDEGATITSPSAVAAGSFMLHIGNKGNRRFRLKYVAAADSELDIIPCGVE